MANCHELFKLYNSAIRLKDDKRTMLRDTRNFLRVKMRKGFAAMPKEHIGEHELKFQSQGSYIMDTIITPYDDDFDLDDGVYFIGNLSVYQRPTTTKFHEWVVQAVGVDEDYAEVSDKDTCVRVRYKKEKFHIDLPIYYSGSFSIPELAHKTENWIVSGPIEFIYWFETKIASGFEKSYLLESGMKDKYRQWATDIRKADVQLRRIVRYLKGWGDILRGDMPPGIILTILAAENYSPNERDDISLKDTLINIQRTLQSNGCKCIRPTTPKGEDLFASYSDTAKNYFLDRLNTFVKSAEMAIANPNQKDACAKWQFHFGNRFSCDTAKDEIEETKSYASPAILGDNAKSAA